MMLPLPMITPLLFAAEATSCLFSPFQAAAMPPPPDIMPIFFFALRAMMPLRFLTLMMLLPMPLSFRYTAAMR